MSDFWNGKKVLVTGGNGFVGSHLVKYLESKQAEVFAPNSTDVDFSDGGEVLDLMDDLSNENIDMVIHLAAKVGGIGANRELPAGFLTQNLLMNTFVLKYARLCLIPKFVGIGSVCAYPAVPPRIPFVEDDLWSGYPEPTNAPYGLTKRMLLVQSQAYRAQYGYNAIHLIPTNIYGPGDKFDLEHSHVIPALIRKCIEAKEHNADFVTVWGTGRATREFLYVDDAVHGIAKAAEFYDKGEPVNLGSGSEISIENLTMMIVRLVGFKGGIAFDNSKPDGQMRRVLNNYRAREEFEWYASTPLEVGLQRTIDWYLENRE